MVLFIIFLNLLFFGMVVIILQQHQRRRPVSIPYTKAEWAAWRAVMRLHSAYMSDIHNGTSLEIIPKEWRSDPMVCYAAVLKDGLSLKFVPECLRDIDICASAVRNNGGSIKYVPREIQAEVLCRVYDTSL